MRRLGFYCGLSVITILSLIPLSTPQTLDSSDKIAHFIAYFILAGLCYFAYPAKKHLLLQGIALMIYGFIIEVLQGQTTYRMFSMMDFLANNLGVITLMLCVYAYEAMQFNSKKIVK